MLCNFFFRFCDNDLSEVIKLHINRIPHNDAMLEFYYNWNNVVFEIKKKLMILNYIH